MIISQAIIICLTLTVILALAVTAFLRQRKGNEPTIEGVKESQVAVFEIIMIIGFALGLVPGTYPLMPVMAALLLGISLNAILHHFEHADEVRLYSLPLFFFLSSLAIFLGSI